MITEYNDKDNEWKVTLSSGVVLKETIFTLRDI